MSQSFKLSVTSKLEGQGLHLILLGSFLSLHQNPGCNPPPFISPLSVPTTKLKIANRWWHNLAAFLMANSACFVLSSLGYSCQESFRKELFPACSFGLLVWVQTNWMVGDVTCMFMIPNKALVIQPQGSSF